MRIARTAAVAMTFVMLSGASGRPGLASGAQRDEGISVHGHWIVEIRNADGSQAARHEFDNHLATAGGLQLASMLAGRVALQPWSVSLAPAPCTQCQHPISQSGGGLTVEAPGNILVLRGRLTADHNDTINEISTLQGAAPITTRSFTSSERIPYVAGQVIDVTVLVTFS